MSRPEVVWVSPELPASPRSGAALRTHRLLQALTPSCSVRVILIGATDVPALMQVTGVQHVEVFSRPRGKRGKGLRMLQHQWPTGTAAAWSPAAHRRVRELAHGALVVADNLQVAAYLPPGHVLALQNAEVRLLEDSPSAGLAAARRAWDLRTTRALERRALANAGTVVTVSQRDADLLGVPALIVPNGTDLPDLVPDLPTSGDLLYVGTLTYQPNRDALRWWAEQVWQPGDQPITVIGGGADELTKQLQVHPSLRLIGEVADVGPWLTRARVVVIPLQHGGGTRLKVLEAMAWGRPVVSTSKGVEGLSVSTEALLADDPAAFRALVLAAQTDEALAQRLAAEGRRFAENYDWRTIGTAFAAEIRQLTAGSTT